MQPASFKMQSPVANLELMLTAANPMVLEPRKALTVTGNQAAEILAFSGSQYWASRPLMGSKATAMLFASWLLGTSDGRSSK